MVRAPDAEAKGMCESPDGKSQIAQTAQLTTEELSMDNDPDLIHYERAASLIGIEPKRLLGRMIRNKLGDPIGGQTPEGIMVYTWSLPPTDDSSVVQP